ncbi:MAG: hypothetical protein IJO52_11455 [Clostridia bacterium]|nr:hypothetical protein [Clostridia bacterium]
MFTFPIILLMVASTAAVVTADSLNNQFGKKMMKTGADMMRVNLVSSLFAVLAFAVMSFFFGGLHVPSFYTVYMGIIFGLVLTFHQIFLYKALACGPYAYTMLFAFCGMILPTAMGAVLFRETINVFQCIGIVFVLVMFYLTTNPEKGEKVNVKWLVFAVAVFFFNGGFGIMQRLFQEFETGEKAQLCEFLMIAFFVLSVYSFISLMRSEKSVSAALKIPSNIVWLSAAVGVTTAMNHQFNLYLSGVLPSVIFFPIINGASVVLTVLVAATVFREKYTVKQYIGLAFGFSAILLLSDVMSNFIKI